MKEETTMLSYAEYLQYPEGKDLVERFFDAVICLRADELEETLAGYARKEGNALNDNAVCYFAGEVPESDPEYFGDRGVAVYRYEPARDVLTIVLVKEEDFCDALTDALERLRKQFTPARCAALTKQLAAVQAKLRPSI